MSLVLYIIASLLMHTASTDVKFLGFCLVICAFVLEMGGIRRE